MAKIQCGDVVFTNIEAVIFDKNGTLEDSQIQLINLAKVSANHLNQKFPGIEQSLLQAFGVNDNSLDLAGLMAVASRYETEIAIASHIVQTGHSWFESLQIARQALDTAETVVGIPAPMFAGCREILEKLAANNYKLGILSAATTREVQAFVRGHQLGEYIQLEMGVDGSISKPNPQLFINACQKLGVEVSQTLMVGDSIGDMQMAKNAGAAGCIGITWIGNQSHVYGADVVINQLVDIQVI